MKTIKLTKNMLKMHPADLLIKLGAVDEKQTSVYPSFVFFSKEDSKKLKSNLREIAKKSAPDSPKRLLDYSVGMDWLNYGPNETLAEAIRPGYALVYEKGIESALREERLKNAIEKMEEINGT